MTDWGKWAEFERTRNRWDKRVQAIRCSACHRLRAHPVTDDRRTWSCACGSVSFVKSGVHPDEIPLAKKLYYRQIEELGTYTKIAQELIAGGGRA